MGDPVTGWAERVAKGKVAACLHVRRAAERHLTDLRRRDLEFDAGAIEKVRAFFGYLRHYKGPLAGEPIDLEHWQLFLLGSVFGWRLKRAGVRRFREAYVQIPRKNGKTTIAAGVALYGLTVDGEAGPEVYTVATKEDQAKLAFRDAKTFTKHSPALSDLVTGRLKELRCEANDGIMRPLGSDSDTLDGLNVHMAVCDELHAWKDGGLYRVVKDGAKARPNALIFTITTAGFNTLSFCKEVRDTGVKVLDPEAADWSADRTFYFIAEPDDPDAWREKRQWYLANPNLGVTISEREFREEIKSAHVPPSTEENVKVKSLNIWLREHKPWFPTREWRQTADESIQLDDLAGRNGFAGLDLAQINDLSAMVLYFPPRFDGDPGILWPEFWCPSEHIRQRSERDMVPYVRWAKAGQLRTTPGNVTDFNYIERDILQLSSSTGVRRVAYDPWAATDLVLRLQARGIEVIECRQGYRTMNPACQELKRLVLGGQIRHPAHPILDWNAENVVVAMDPAGNVKFDKARSHDRIDGMVAAAMAVGLALSQQTEGPSVYEERGVRIL